MGFDKDGNWVPDSVIDTNMFNIRKDRNGNFVSDLSVKNDAAIASDINFDMSKNPGAKPTSTDMTGYQKAALGLQGIGTYIDWENLGVLKDSLAFNIKDKTAEYAANATQVNNMVNSSNNINRNVTNKVNAMQVANGGLANASYNDKQTVAKTL